MKSFVSKLPDVGTTIFSVMTKMALDHDAINLSQGYPDFSVPSALIERLHHYALAGENQYPPMQGIAYLREQIAVKVQQSYGVQLDHEMEITVTSGATEALFVAVQVLVHPGDEVIVFDPAYDAYDPAIRLAGGVTRHIPLTDREFKIDWQRVRETINHRTRAIIINSPHNPTGTTLDLNDLSNLSDLVQSHDLYVISDEVYEHMVYGDHTHHSLVGNDLLRQRSFVVSSFGKTYHATGWKVGYCIAPALLTTEFRKIHQFVTFTTHTPTQWAIADFLAHCPEHHQSLAGFYEKKRDLFLREMQDIGLSFVPSCGTYFQMANYEALSSEGDVDFVTHLTKTVGVAAIPVSVFYANPPSTKFIRFCFAKADDTLIEAARRIRSAFA